MWGIDSFLYMTKHYFVIASRIFTVW